jgi:hypothetical protein
MCEIEMDFGLDTRARIALGEARAIRCCEFHSDVMIRVGDYGAERRAYAFATNSLKREAMSEFRPILMKAVNREIDMAADGECPVCANNRDE